MQSYDALCVKFVRLVVPNYPYLSGTDILVDSAVSCALRGTQEQRNLARDARETLEAILLLDRTDALWQLASQMVSSRIQFGPLPAIRGSQRSTMEADRVASGLARAQNCSATARRLPTELLIRVLDFFMESVAPPDNGLRLLALGHLRLLDRSFAGYAIRKHAKLFKRYTDRVVARLLHLEGRDAGRPLPLVYSCAFLLAQVTELDVYLHEEDIDRLNIVLPLLTTLRALSLHLDSTWIHLCDINLLHNNRLRDLRIHTASPTSTDLRDIKRVRRARTADEWEALDAARARHHRHSWSAARSLRCLNLNGTIWERGSTGVGCVGSLLQHVDLVKQLEMEGCDMDGQQLGELQLRTWRLLAQNGACALNLADNHNIDDDVCRDLQLGRGRGLATLNLANCSITDPAALALGTNYSITRLSLADNELASGTIGLARNTRLKALDCSGCLSTTSAAQRQLFLRQLSEDLKFNTTLRDLWLSGGEYSDSALNDDDLAALDLSSNTGLRRLYLTGNYDLTIESLKALRQRTNDALKAVFFDDNDGELQEEWETWDQQQEGGFLLRLDGSPNW